MPDLSDNLAFNAEEKTALRRTLARLGRTATVGAAPAIAASAHTDSKLAPWYDADALAGEVARLSAAPAKDQTDSEREYLRFLHKVEAAPVLRRRCVPPAPAAFFDLVARFPNFAEPLRFLAEQSALAALRADGRADFIPILLTGPAGIGKTHFAMALAEVFGTTTEVLSMASQSCGFALSGMDRGWSTARPGLVFNALLHGETLSPIIVLDEIDKTNADSRSDPLGPLYSLLERRSAREFRDEFAGFPVDASQVFWLATANDSNCLPAPLLSRFKVFDIGAPDGAQAAAIAQKIYQEMAAALSGAPDCLPSTWAAQCAGCSVRDIRILLQQALGSAALRAVLSGADTMEVCAADLVTEVPALKRIGFL